MATAMKLKCLTMIRQFDYNGRLTVCMCIYVTHTYIDYRFAQDDKAGHGDKAEILDNDQAVRL